MAPAATFLLHVRTNVKYEIIGFDRRASDRRLMVRLRNPLEVVMHMPHDYVEEELAAQRMKIVATGDWIDRPHFTIVGEVYHCDAAMLARVEFK